MIGDELYIEGQRADMMSDSGISLEYKSNIFGDLSKITGNYSHTIKLPRTSKNMALIGGGIHVGSTSTYHKTTHSAMVKRNGVPIVTRASLYLMKVSPDSIEVVLTWGVGTNLRRLISEKDKLSGINTLVDDAGQAYTDIPYGEVTSTKKRWLPKFSQGLNGLDKVYNMPAVPVRDIIRGIERKYGVTLNFNSTQPNGWSIPVTKAGGNTGDYGYNLATTDIDSYESTDAIPLFIGRGSSHYLHGSDAEWVQRTIYGTRTYTIDNRISGGEQKVRASISADFTMWRYGTGADNYATADDIRLVLASITPTATGVSTYKIDADNIIQEIKPISVEKVPSLYTKFVFNDVIEYNQPPAMPICAFIYAGGKLIYKGVEGSMYSKMTCRFDAEYDTTSIDLESARLRGNMPISTNLPDIDVVAFIKAISQMCGLFPVVGANSNTVDFVPFSTLTDKSRAVDWSKYLVADKSWIPNMEYKTGNEGRTNLFKYKDANNDWDASFTIDNENLDEEKTIVTLPFSTFMSLGGTAYIPLFEYAESKYYENKKVYNFKGSSNAYIMQTITVEDELIGVDLGVKWSVLINNYNAYISMLRDAKVITETFTLSCVQLSEIDMTAPVYIKQYGAYFGIIEIKTKANDTAEVKLIKI